MALKALMAAAVGTLLVNLPFGWWREGTRKLSPLWFVAVHAPVPLVIAVRRLAGVSLGWGTLPVLVLAYFLGQALGARARRATRRAGAADLEGTTVGGDGARG